MAWQRSALAFVPTLLASGSFHSQHASVLQALAVEAKKVDMRLIAAREAGIEAVREMDMIGKQEVPEGVPRTHWWWWLLDKPPPTNMPTE